MEEMKMTKHLNPEQRQYEDAARAAKVAALADAFDRVAGPLFARLPADQRGRLVAASAKEASEAFWVDLAAVEGIRVPSATTIAGVVRLLAIRANRAGKDPLEGLPQ